MERWIALFYLGQFFAIFTWRIANAVLIDTLQHYYRSSHQMAGAPDMSFIASPGRFNARWAAHILFLKFRSDLPETRPLRGPFWFAFASGWYMALGVVLLVLIAIGVVQPSA